MTNSESLRVLQKAIVRRPCCTHSAKREAISTIGEVRAELVSTPALPKRAVAAFAGDAAEVMVEIFDAAACLEERLVGRGSFLSSSSFLFLLLVLIPTV